MTTTVTEKATPEPVVEQPKSAAETLYPEKTEEKGEAKTEEKIEEKTEEKKPEAKAEEKPAAEEKKPEEKTEAAAKVVPEKYDFKAPEGMTLDDAEVGKFSELAKKAQLDQTIAQELVDFHFETLKKAGSDLVAAQQNQWNEIQNAWKAEVDKDPELGAQKTEVTTRIGRLLDEYGSKEARDAFDTTGAGNNPAIIRLLNNIAKKVVEAGPRPNGDPLKGKGPRTLGGILYPSTEKGN